MAKNQGLGRGLSSLIPYKSKESRGFLEALDHEKILKVRINEIQANPLQPRGVIESRALEDLINSIREHGILQPLIVSRSPDGGYILIAGERRLKASKIIGLDKVPVIVREASRQESLEIALVENLQRKNLNPIEEAMAFKKLIDEFNMNQEGVAKRVGKSREAVTNTLRLLSLPREIQKALAMETITEGHAKAILALPSEKAQTKLYQAILKSRLSVRKAEHFSHSLRKKGFMLERMAPDTVEKEGSLRDFLGTRVKITRQGRRGKVIIEYYSQIELEQIIKKILK